MIYLLSVVLSFVNILCGRGGREESGSSGGGGNAVTTGEAVIVA